MRAVSSPLSPCFIVRVNTTLAYVGGGVVGGAAVVLTAPLTVGASLDATGRVDSPSAAAAPVDAFSSLLLQAVRLRRATTRADAVSRTERESTFRSSLSIRGCRATEGRAYRPHQAMSGHRAEGTVMLRNSRRSPNISRRIL